jgi:hypothetical protein
MKIGACESEKSVRQSELFMTLSPRRRRRYVPQAFKKVLLRDAKSCVYCGKTFVQRSHERSVDHMIPDRPDDDLTNLVVRCFDCNMRKGRKPYSEWVASLPRSDAKRAVHLYLCKFGELPPPPLHDEQLLLLPEWRITGYVPEEDDV